MSKRLKIGIDVDGVLVDFVAAFNREATKVLGRPVNKRPTQWDFTDVMPKEDFSKVWLSVRQSYDWFKVNAIPIKEALEHLKGLTEQHDVYFITTRIETKGTPVSKQTAATLIRFGVQYPTVIVTSNKGAIASALELNAFIDDRFENCEDVYAATIVEAKPTKVFLMDAIYNHQAIPPDWTRVLSFTEFVHKIKELADE